MIWLVAIPLFLFWAAGTYVAFYGLRTNYRAYALFNDKKQTFAICCRHLVIACFWFVWGWKSSWSERAYKV
jgi:hypothetical protein